MSRILASFLAVSALIAAPAWAQELVSSGEISIDGGFRTINSDDDGSGDTAQIGFGGIVGIPIAGGFSVQGDGRLEWYSKGNDTEDPRLNALLGGHLSYRNPEAFLVGAFGGYGWSDLEADASYELFLVGGEAQVYVGDLTLYGQAGYVDNTKSDGEREGYQTGWFVRGEGRYFFTDDAMASANIFYGEATPYIDGDDDGEILSWGLSGKIRLLDDLPLYGTLGYRGARYDSTSEGDVLVEHVFMVGLTFHFGANSLKHADRYGANLSLPMTPVRANGFAELID